MLNNYKIICNTAAGRRRYMQYLIPFVVANDIVDRYDIWVNTTNRQDIAFFQILQKAFPKINLVYQPDGVVDGCRSISAFYRQCVEEDAIYFKLDDDIVWMEPDMIEKMVRFRIDNPGYFIVSPLVINNPICTYILQNTGKIKLNKYYPAQVGHDILNQTFNLYFERKTLLCFDDIPLLSARDIKRWIIFKLHRQVSEDDMIDQMFERHCRRQADINNAGDKQILIC